MKRQFFGVVAGISTFLIATGVTAEEKTLCEWSDNAAVLKKEWSGKIKYEKIDGKLCGVTTSRSYIKSKKLFPVEAGKKYTISGSFKGLGQEKSKVYFGYMTYDKNKKYVAHYHSNVILGSGTILAKDCKKGSKSLLVKANKKWKKSLTVAFNVKDDFSDLPNRDVVYKIFKVTPQEDGNMLVELTKPVNKDYPEETKVRAHTSAYGTYLYTAIAGSKLSSDWKSYKGTATLAVPGKMSHKLFRPGTAFVRILILPNYGKKKDAKMAFKDLTLKVTE